MDVNKTRTQGDFYYVVTIASENNQSDFSAAWYVNDGERFLRQGSSASVPRPSLTSIPFAPENPNNPVGIKEIVQTTVILGTYPNPFADYVVVQFYIEKATHVNVKVIDVTGKIISSNSYGNVSQGLHLHSFDLKNTAEGMYFLLIETENYKATQKLMKGRK